MLLPETVTDRGKELGSDGELKQPDVSKKASDLADSKVGLGSLPVEFGLIGTEPLFCQCLVTLEFELELSSLSALTADIDAKLGRRS